MLGKKPIAVALSKAHYGSPAVVLNGVGLGFERVEIDVVMSGEQVVQNFAHLINIAASIQLFSPKLLRRAANHSAGLKTCSG
jgi:hypothetical protein